jgi:hypothetical protein
MTHSIRQVHEPQKLGTAAAASQMYKLRPVQDLGDVSVGAHVGDDDPLVCYPSSSLMEDSRVLSQE